MRENATVTSCLWGHPHKLKFTRRQGALWRSASATEKTERDGGIEMNKITCICLGVRDVEQAIAFYRDKLGFSMDCCGFKRGTK